MRNVHHSEMQPVLLIFFCDGCSRGPGTTALLELDAVDHNLRHLGQESCHKIPITTCQIKTSVTCLIFLQSWMCVGWTALNRDCSRRALIWTVWLGQSIFYLRWSWEGKGKEGNWMHYCSNPSGSLDISAPVLLWTQNSSVHYIGAYVPKHTL